MPAEDENCYKLSRVLCEEFEALRPGCFTNVDTRQPRDEKKKRQDAYNVAHNLGLSALALSSVRAYSWQRAKRPTTWPAPP